MPTGLRGVVGHPRIALRLGTSIWHARRNDDGTFRFWTDGPNGGGAIDARAVVVATGATELVLPFPGWDLPGVMTAGAAQTLVKAQGVLPGRRVLVAGTGPFLLPVAAALAKAGAAVAVADCARPGLRVPVLAGLAHPGKAAEAGGYMATLARHRVPVWFGQAVAACEGTDRVQRVKLVSTDGSKGRPGRTLQVDAVCASFGFVPSLDLPRALGCAERPHPVLPLSTVAHDADQATSVPGVFAAGEVTGIGGAHVALLEGLVAGAAAARFLGRPAATPDRSMRLRLRRARRFAALLERLYPPDAGWLERLTDDTVMCRCEDVRWRAVRDALDHGAGDLRAVKGTTRCGMGYCQGRMCGPALQLAVRALTGRQDVGDFATRSIATPVPIRAIADLEDFRR